MRRFDDLSDSYCRNWMEKKKAHTTNITTAGEKVQMREKERERTENGEERENCVISGLLLRQQ